MKKKGMELGKKIVSMVLALTMTVTAMPAQTIFAADESTTAPFTVTAAYNQDRNKNDLGLKQVTGLEVVQVYKPSDDADTTDDTFCNGVVMTEFKGKLYCQWQSSDLIEDDKATTIVVYSVSSDNGKTWSEPIQISPVENNENEYYSSGGWHVYDENGDGEDDTIVAYLNYWPELDIRGGYTRYRSSNDGVEWTPVADVTMDDGITPLYGIFEQDPHVLENGRIVNSAHFQTEAGKGGLIINPIYTDDKSGVTGWTKATFTSSTDYIYGYISNTNTVNSITTREMEPSLYVKSNGNLVMVFRDQKTTEAESYVLASESTDNGKTWSKPSLTKLLDAVQKQSAGNLPDGTAFIVNCPTTNDDKAKRFPLTITLSKDGESFTDAYVVGLGTKEALGTIVHQADDVVDSDGNVTTEGAKITKKRLGYHYPKSVVIGNYLYVSYAKNKEIVEYVRIPLESISLNGGWKKIGEIESTDSTYYMPGEMTYTNDNGYIIARQGLGSADRCSLSINSSGNGYVTSSIKVTSAIEGDNTDEGIADTDDDYWSGELNSADIVDVNKWYIDGYNSGRIYCKVGDSIYYLCNNSGGLGITNTLENATKWQFSWPGWPEKNVDGIANNLLHYKSIKSGDDSILFNGSAGDTNGTFGLNNGGKAITLYSIETDDEYAKLDGELNYDITASQSNLTEADIISKASVLYKVVDPVTGTESDSATIPLTDTNISYAWENGDELDTYTAGTYRLAVKYNGEDVGVITVNVEAPEWTKVSSSVTYTLTDTMDVGKPYIIGNWFYALEYSEDNYPHIILSNDTDFTVSDKDSGYVFSYTQTEGGITADFENVSKKDIWIKDSNGRLYNSYDGINRQYLVIGSDYSVYLSETESDGSIWNIEIYNEQNIVFTTTIEGETVYLCGAAGDGYIGMLGEDNRGRGQATLWGISGSDTYAYLLGKTDYTIESGSIDEFKVAIANETKICVKEVNVDGTESIKEVSLDDSNVAIEWSKNGNIWTAGIYYLGTYLGDITIRGVDEHLESLSWVDVTDYYYERVTSLDSNRDYIITESSLNSSIDVIGSNIENVVSIGTIGSYSKNQLITVKCIGTNQYKIEGVNSENTWTYTESGYLIANVTIGESHLVGINADDSPYLIRAQLSNNVKNYNWQTIWEIVNPSDKEKTVVLKNTQINKNNEVGYLSYSNSVFSEISENDSTSTIMSLYSLADIPVQEVAMDGKDAYKVVANKNSMSQTYIMANTDVYLRTTAVDGTELIERIPWTDLTYSWQYTDAEGNTSTESTLDADAVGNHVMTIYYNGYVVDTVTVDVVSIQSVEYTGSSWIGTGINREPDLSSAKVTVKYSDGTQEDITIENGLEISGYDITTPGTYETTVKYLGDEVPYAYLAVYVDSSPYYNISDATSYPEYPAPGSVRINKTATNDTELEWYDTGVTKVELDVAGVSVKNGIDVILVTDISNSMGRWYKDADGNDLKDQPGQKLNEAMTAATDFARLLLSNNDSNTATNNSISFVTFGGYDIDNTSGETEKTYKDASGQSVTIPYLDSTQTVFVYEQDFADAEKSFSGTKFLSYSSPTDQVQITDNEGNVVSGYNSGGTNYDYAFAEAANAVSELKSAYFKTNNKDYDASGREIVVLFMTDGAPTYYNYELVNNSGGSPNYLYGTKIQYPASRASYYPTVLKAKKSDGTDYKDAEIVDKVVNTINTGSEYSEFTKTFGEYWALGADNWYAHVKNANEYAVKLNEMVDDIYAVGFKMKEDLGISKHCYNWDVNKFTSVLSGVAGIENGINAVSGVVLAEDATSLAASYAEILENVSNSGTAATVRDEIKSEFTLFRGESIKKINTVDGNVVDTGVIPYIEVRKYELYSATDTNIPEGASVGDRNGNYEVLEQVSFECDSEGNVIAAYSNLNPSDNILNVIDDYNYTINAENFTFYYYGGWEYFDWYIPEIAGYEYALSYYAYLEGTNPNYETDWDGNGSGDTWRGDGIYDTNQTASLTYVDIDGNKAQKYFPVPNRPWGELVTTVEYYLVNENGEPVNRIGQVIPFANRIKVGSSVTVPLNWNNGTEGETINGSTYVPGGYRMHNTEASYTVYTQSNNVGTLVISDSNSSTNTASTVWSNQGSVISTSGDTSYYDVSSTIVEFGVVMAVNLTVDSANRLGKDQIVVDYGKAIEENVFDNNPKINKTNDIYYTENNAYQAEVVGFYPYSSDSIYVEYVQNEPGTSTYEGKYGTFSIVDAGTVKYQPTAVVSSVERVFTVVKFTSCSNLEDIYYLYQEFDVIPASNVHYETNFSGEVNASNVFTLQTSGDAWSEKKDSDENASTSNASDNLQQDGTIGVVEGRTAHIYGYDPSYDNDSLLSNCSSFFVEGKGTGTVKNTIAKFSFKGTGFDIISKTGKTQGMIRVTVYEAGRTDVYEKRMSVLNVAESAWGELYQIPVISIEDLSYGNHDVVIEVFDSATYNGALASLNRDNDFYFDAVRIYNPLGKQLEGDIEEIGEMAYLTDGEAYPVINEVRDLLIEEFETEGTDVNQNGVVFIERYAEDGEAGGSVTHNYKFAEYKAIGPNNETYLSEGQAIAFKITGIDINSIGSIDIGAKSVDGSEVKLKATIANSTNFSSGTGNATTIEETISSNSSQYFELYGKDNSNRLSSFATDSNGSGCAYVYITNALAESGSDNTNETGAKVLSITDIKVAYTTASVSVNSEEEIAYVATASLLDFADACYELTADYDVDSASFTTEETKVFGNAKLVVETSQYVDSLSITDRFGRPVTATTNYVDNGNGIRTWTVILLMNKIGNQIYKVTAHSSDGVSGDTMTATIEVKTTEGGGWQDAKSIYKTLFNCRILSIKRSGGSRLFSERN